MIDEKRSISQLEGWTWNIEIPTEDNSSFEEYNFYLLHNKPLREYSAEDICFMIGQESGLKFFVPEAINYLRQDVLIHAEDFEGDLLSRVLNLPKDFWQAFPEVYQEMLHLVNNEISDLNFKDLHYDVAKLIKRSIQTFLAS